MEESKITPALLEKEQKAQFNSFRASRREEEYWILKSCNTWLKSRDRNTSFFHKQCRVILSQNHISKISSQSDEAVKGISQIKQLAEVHFQNLYREDGSSNSDFTSDFFSNILSLVSEEENDELVNHFSKQEIIVLSGPWSRIKLQALMVSPFIFIEFAGQ